MMTCRFEDRQMQKRTDLCTFDCISTQKGAKEVSCPEIYEPVAVWRSMLKYLQ